MYVGSRDSSRVSALTLGGDVDCWGQLISWLRKDVAQWPLSEQGSGLWELFSLPEPFKLPGSPVNSPVPLLLMTFFFPPRLSFTFVTQSGV